MIYKHEKIIRCCTTKISYILNETYVCNLSINIALIIRNQVGLVTYNNSYETKHEIF